VAWRQATDALQDNHDRSRKSTYASNKLAIVDTLAT
jgi:hypothetical protein